MNFWRVAGILCLVGIEALLYGYSHPFFSLALEKRELANWLIGLNASIAGVGILILSPLLPALIARFGVNMLVAGLFAASFLSFAAVLLTDNLIVWFVARFVMGGCLAALWTATEIWLNGVADKRHRGRIVGASSTLYATFQFLGPLVLGEVGIGGSLPILVAMAPLAVGVLIALSVRPTGAEEEEEIGLGDPKNLRLALAVAGGLLAAAFLGGFGETAMRSLLPLYGLAHGLDDAGAARLVAIFALGEAVLVAVLGWIADRFGRRATFRACALAAALSTLAIPFTAGVTMLFWPALFVAGGTIAGIYTLGIVLIGQDFRGHRLAVVSAGFAAAYSAGSIVGPTPVGFLIDAVGAEALPLAIASAFFGLSTYLFGFDDSSERARQDSTAVVPSLKYLEDSQFEDEAEGTDPEFPPEAETGATAASDSGASAFRPSRSEPSTFGSELSQREQDPRANHLEERFKRRSADIAEIIARRQKSREARQGSPPSAAERSPPAEPQPPQEPDDPAPRAPSDDD